MKASGTRVRRASLLASAVAVSVCGVAPAQTAAPEQSDTTIRVNVQLVRILATVKDEKGALVGSLDRNAFSITDNGVPQ